MATAAQAIEKIVAATGEPEARVFYAARHLRHADPSLWPRGRQGGGKGAAHVTVHHLINLLLAVLAADPLTQAPDTVRQYRAFRRVETDPAFGVSTNAGDLVLTPPGLSFGDALDRIVGLCLDPSQRANVAASLDHIALWRKDRAAIIVRQGDGSQRIVCYGPQEQEMPLMAAAQTQPPAPVRVSITIGAAIFAILADLVRDSHDTSGPETIAPASGGTGPAQSVVSHPHANADLGAGTHRKGRDLRGKKQLLSFATPGSPSCVASMQQKGEPPWKRSILS